MRWRFSLLIPLLLFPAHSVAAQGVTRPAEHVESSGFRAEDYPDNALRREAQGLSSVRFEVDEAGRVVPQSCEVTVTSGHRSLDERTCEIIERRYRFVPATENGVLVRDRKALGIFWRIPDTSHPLDATLAQRLIHHSGNCWLKAAPEATQMLVDLPIGSVDQTAAASALLTAQPRCMSEIRNAPTLQIASAAAEALMIKQFRGVGPSLPPGATPIIMRSGTEELAFCVVRRDPVATRQLVDSAPTSAEEATALARLVPHLQACVAPGNTLRFSKPSLRALFAIALYRDAAHAASVAPQR